MWRLRGTGGKAAEVSERPSYRHSTPGKKWRDAETGPQWKEGTWGTGGQIVKWTPQDFDHDWILGCKGPAVRYGSH